MVDNIYGLFAKSKSRKQNERALTSAHIRVDHVAAKMSSTISHRKLQWIIRIVRENGSVSRGVKFHLEEFVIVVAGMAMQLII